jgi:hypothetical protein
MTMREKVLVLAFLLCFLVLLSPLLGWYLFFVIPDNPLSAPTKLAKIIVEMLGAQNRNLNLLNLLFTFMAPIGVLIAAMISGSPNSPLILIAVPFLLALVLAVIAPFTITMDIENNIGTILNQIEPKIWVENAQAAFSRYAERYASTSAVLLGLEMTRRHVK